ncbi:MAG: ACT domain-containing protein [Eggerthellaceae bacterium]|nr:ACT domain-containing protein [Eggerthellaceae bacterium]
MPIKQISVFLENKPGTLQELCKVLADSNINMRALSLAETKDFGIARIIVDSVIEAADVLKNADFIFKTTPVVAAYVPDYAGGLNAVLETFSQHDINVEYMYAFLGEDEKPATMLFRVGDNTEAAEGVLRKAGIEIITQEDITNM